MWVRESSRLRCRMKRSTSDKFRSPAPRERICCVPRVANLVLMIHRHLRHRAWLNLIFWFVWAVAGILATLAWHVKPDSVVSLVLASAALWVNLYPRFLQGPKITCLVNQITILELTAANQTALIIDMAIQDLLSENPTAEARQFTASNEIVRDAVRRRSAETLRSLFAQTPPPKYGYVPRDTAIREWLKDPRATPSFFAPLFVYNSGSQYGEIGSVIMIAELLNNSKQQWVYAAYFEMDETKLIHIHHPSRDVEKLSRFFAGAAVPPSGTMKLNLQFVPHFSALGVELAKTNLVAGEYNLRFYGIDPNGREIFRADLKGYPLNEHTLLSCFKNGQWTYAAGLEQSMLKLLHRSR